MEDTERIATIEGHCRAARYPEALITAVASYLSGQGTLAEVQEAWQANTNNKNLYPLFVTFPHQDSPSLGILDQRLIDIFLTLDQMSALLQRLWWVGPFEQVRAYLFSKGVDEECLLDYALGAVKLYPYY